MRSAPAHPRTRRIAACVGLALLMVLLALLPAAPGLAQDTAQGMAAPPLQTGVPPTSQPSATPTPDRPPSIIQQILHLIVFNDRTMSEAITRALLRMFGGMLDEAIGPVNTVIRDTLVFLDVRGFAGAADPNAEDSGIAKLESLRYEAWKTMRTIAGILLPLSLALTVGAALREGTVSITGYASAREALLEWLFSIALAGASWLLISLGLQLAHAAAQGILATFSVNLRTDPFLLREVITGGISKGETFLTDTPLLLQLFVSLFALFLVGAVAVSMVLAILARYVLLFLITATAPLMLVLGGLRPMRWLASFWSRAMLLILLLGPMNALLLGLAMRLQQIALSATTGLAGTVFSLLTLVGVLSVLISINSMVARGAYGAAIEMAHRAVHATGQLITLAFALAGAAAALPALGPAGGAAAGGAIGRVAPGIGPGGAGGSAVPTGGLPPMPLAGGAPYDAFRTRGGDGRLAGELGQILSAVNTPVTRGLGMGLRVAGAVQRARGLPQRTGMPGGGPPLAPGPDPALEQHHDFTGGAPGEAAARQALQTSLAGQGAALLRRGMTIPQAQASAARGVQLGASALQAGQEQLGLAPGRLLASLGFDARRETLAGAGSRFLQATAGAYAFGEPLPWQAQPPAAPASLERVDAQDVAAAVQILSARPAAFALANPPGMAALARLSFQLRREQHYATPAAVVQAATAYGRGDVLDWMQESYAQLSSPPTELAQALAALRAGRTGASHE